MMKKKFALSSLHLTLGVIGIILISIFPVIIWDALGNGAQHFVYYGNPGVSGDSSGNSAVKFIFGTFWTENFNVIKLFSGQWRIVEGVNQSTGTAFSDTMAVIMFISIIALLIMCIFEIISYVVSKIKKLEDNQLVNKIDKIATFVILGLAVFIAVIIAIPTFTMASKISIIDFRQQDFNAYGGMKGLIEFAIAILFVILYGIKLIPIFIKDKSKAK